MDQEEITVGIGQIVVHHNPITLACIGLGSCIGVALYDIEAHIGGLAHVMLPDSREYAGKLKDNRNTEKLLKYADVAIPKMIEDMIKIGAQKTRIYAKLAGGAQMFKTLDTIHSKIGERNAEAVKKALGENNIRIGAEDLGGYVGRTLKFNTVTHNLKIKTINGEKEI